MPRPRSLTPTALATAALAVIDRDGLAALSMRTVAAELGMAPMSLYRYVADRAELEGLVVDLLLAQIDTTPPARAPWTRKVAVLVERARDAVAAHPRAVPLTLTHPVRAGQRREVRGAAPAQGVGHLIPVLGRLAEPAALGRERAARTDRRRLLG